ncbi:MAG: hypothetical protein ACRYG2_25675 [Janthinobacterium lividum]
MSEGSTLHVDCDSCSARGPACTDCVVTVLLGIPGPRVDLDGDEQQALSALAGSGLVPPLRLVPRARPARSVPSPGPAYWEGLDEPGIFTGFVTGAEG